MRAWNTVSRGDHTVVFFGTDPRAGRRTEAAVFVTMFVEREGGWELVTVAARGTETSTVETEAGTMVATSATPPKDEGGTEAATVEGATGTVVTFPGPTPAKVVGGTTDETSSAPSVVAGAAEPIIGAAAEARKLPKAATGAGTPKGNN